MPIGRPRVVSQDRTCRVCGKPFRAYPSKPLNFVENFCSVACKRIAYPVVRREMTTELVRELLDYDPATGICRWRVACNTTSTTRQIGDIAGSLMPPTRNGGGGYLTVWIEGRAYKLHRLIWLHVTGQWPDPEVDHINLNRANNRWTNLREATRSQNSANSPGWRKRQGLKGAYRVNKNRGDKKCGWVSYITVERNRIYLGFFKAAEEAHAAYVEAARKHHDEFAHDGVKPLAPASRKRRPQS